MSSTAAEAEQFKAAGDRAFRSGDYASAVENYTKAIGVDGDNHVYYSNRSAAYLKMGDGASALNDAMKTIKTNSNFVKGYHRKGEALHSMKRYDEAIVAFGEGRAKAKSPKDSTAFEEAMEHARHEKGKTIQTIDGQPVGDNLRNFLGLVGKMANVMRAVEGGRGVEKGLELKKMRDELDAVLANKTDANEKDVDQIRANQLMCTLMMNKCGLFDEEKHSSALYAEEDDELSKLPSLRQEMEATDEVIREAREKKEMEKCQMEDQLRLLQGKMRALNLAARDEQRAKEGVPSSPQKYEPWHCTLVDDELFQPCPPAPDCPLCFLPRPDGRDGMEYTYLTCCGKRITDTEHIKQTVLRVELGDKEAMHILGMHYLLGRPPIKKDPNKGLELIRRAANLGLKAAHHNLGAMHLHGQGGVEKDMEKARYHLRLAAIGGSLSSRFALGTMQEHEPELAMKHYIIAAEAGHRESLEQVKRGYSQGYVEKHVFARCLRAHQAAEDDTKSEQRAKAARRRESENEWKKATSGDPFLAEASKAETAAEGTTEVRAIELNTRSISEMQLALEQSEEYHPANGKDSADGDAEAPDAPAADANGEEGAMSINEDGSAMRDLELLRHHLCQIEKLRGRMSARIDAGSEEMGYESDENRG